MRDGDVIGVVVLSHIFVSNLVMMMDVLLVLSVMLDNMVAYLNILKTVMHGNGSDFNHHDDLVDGLKQINMVGPVVLTRGIMDIKRRRQLGYMRYAADCPNSYGDQPESG